MGKFYVTISAVHGEITPRSGVEYRMAPDCWAIFEGPFPPARKGFAWVYADRRQAEKRFDERAAGDGEQSMQELWEVDSWRLASAASKAVNRQGLLLRRRLIPVEMQEAGRQFRFLMYRLSAHRDMARLTAFIEQALSIHPEIDPQDYLDVVRNSDGLDPQGTVNMLGRVVIGLYRSGYLGRQAVDDLVKKLETGWSEAYFIPVRLRSGVEAHNPNPHTA